jgi:hypothetical protein
MLQPMENMHPSLQMMLDLFLHISSSGYYSDKKTHIIRRSKKARYALLEKDCGTVLWIEISSVNCIHLL